MNKRGQLTIFIIMAILIVAGVAMFFAFRGDVNNKSSGGVDVEPVYDFVEYCIKNVGEEILYQIGQGGGYYFPPELSNKDGITYYYFDKKNNMPSKEDVMQEISYYLSEKLPICIRGFSDFPEYNFSKGEVKAEVEILEDQIIFDVEYLITVSKGDSSSSLDDFKVYIPSRLDVIYDAVKESIEKEIEQQSICLNCLNEIAVKYDLYVDMQETEDGIIFIFTDKQVQLNNVDYQFIYVNSY